MKHRAASIPNGTRDSLRNLYAFVHPNGKLDAVIDAQSLSDAWVIATGWGDHADISERVERGWRMFPCVVEWEDNEA